MTSLKTKYPQKTFKNRVMDVAVRFDTFQDAEGYDRLIKNALRILSLFAFLYLMTHELFFPVRLLLLFIVMLVVGLTRFEWLVHKRKRFYFEAWT